MGFAETLAARKVPGQKGAFLIDAAGAVSAQNCDQSAAAQSTELAKQIADIVGLPGLDTVWISSDSGTIGIRMTSRGTAGSWLGPDGDVAAAKALLDALVQATAAAPAGVSADAVNQIRKVATEYLTDFAETALMIQIKQAGLDEKNPQADQLAKLAGGLEKAALMIIGPSRAKEMGEKLKRAIS
jgi:hypothetical protein